MSVQHEGLAVVPEETARVARAAFPRGCLAIRLRDELGVVFTDEQFAGLFPVRGRPAWSPGRLALISVLQFAEGMSDRQAADAVRARIDWKYALGMELTDPGFDFSVLSEFRGRLISGGAEQDLLDSVLRTAAGAGLLGRGGRQRTDSTHVLTSARMVNRLELVGEVLRSALNALAAADSAWMSGHVRPEWLDRYARRWEDFRLPKSPNGRVGLAETIGADGMEVLRSVFAPGAPPGLRWLPRVELLRQVWVQQYWVEDGTVRQRTSKEMPPGARRIVSPFDPECRAGVKRDTNWDGYKVHLTETCDESGPHLITCVLTTASPGSDYDAVPLVHQALAERELLPDEHLVDTGYVSAGNLAGARCDHGVELIGPTMPDNGWQTEEGAGFTVADFTIDWDNQRVTCPNGAVSTRWATERAKGADVIRVQFSRRDCGPCPERPRCTRASIPRRRMTLRGDREEFEALQRARAQQNTDEWLGRYQARQGIEGTISQAVRAFGLRRSRYRGHAKTHLQHVLTAAAVNFTRLDAWLTGTPLALTRVTPLGRLRLAA
ncbi:IS1182 family transposase [Kitasatospora xanthocidica]|uniref:IS1182 family transposase n=1 Tax=Kitasatospora xanthocidica TaxID=83382 RepID=A0A372ZUN0_9ACTN|nr:IS1182 family transposase [Kitasatospora xanthocidica]RGD59583.1 IS1182 family transposase [Kitasatospora xanthocidica]